VKIGATPVTPATSASLAPTYVSAPHAPSGGRRGAVIFEPEQLREVFTAKATPGKQLLAGWLSWASRSRLPEFVALAKTIKRYLPLIHNTLEHGVSNALSEATNTHLRLLTRRAYGYHSAEALIAMATLTRGGLCPPLPGRS
jgi:transposase